LNVWSVSGNVFVEDDPLDPLDCAGDIQADSNAMAKENAKVEIEEPTSHMTGNQGSLGTMSLDCGVYAREA
jgi:hypothetical protein